MKTLLERAKPQLLEAMAKQRENYPTITAEVEEHLKNTYSVVNLKWGVWVDVRSLWMQSTGILKDAPWEMFND
jgi:hypothetical protein